MTGRILAGLVAIACVGALAVAPAGASGPPVATYDVTIENLTRGQPFTPPVIATHRGAGAIWHPSRASSFQVKEIAENGNNAPLLDLLRQRRLSGRVFDYVNMASTAMAPGPLVPAGRPGSATFPATVKARIRSSRREDRLSWVSMLVCTNDGITGVDGMRLPSKRGRSVTVKVAAYETQTERNTEDLADIMPPCQGLIGARAPDGAPGVAQSNPELREEGVIIPHSGLVGGKELDPAVHGWGNPVGKIVVRRVR